MGLKIKEPIRLGPPSTEGRIKIPESFLERPLSQEQLERIMDDFPNSEVIEGQVSSMPHTTLERYQESVAQLLLEETVEKALKIKGISPTHYCDALVYLLHIHEMNNTDIINMSRTILYNHLQPKLEQPDLTYSQ